MRDISDVQKDISKIKEEISKVKEEKAPIDKELETRAAAFAKETQPLHTEVEQLEEEREKVRKVPAPTPSPYYIVGIVVSIAALLASLFLHWHIVLKGAFVAISIVFIIIRSVKKNQLDKAHSKVIKSKTEEIEKGIAELYQKIDKIESADPRIRELQNISSELFSKQWDLEQNLKKLEQEMNEIKLFKKIENCVIIYVNNKTYHYRDFGANILVDGNDRGRVGQPFSVVGLSSGMHSLVVEFDTGFQTFRTKAPEQFSLSGNVQYFYYEFFSPSDKKYDVKVVKCTSLSDFLSRSKIPEYKFRDYIDSL